MRPTITSPNSKKLTKEMRPNAIANCVLEARLSSTHTSSSRSPMPLSLYCSVGHRSLGCFDSGLRTLELNAADASIRLAIESNLYTTVTCSRTLCSLGDLLLDLGQGRPHQVDLGRQLDVEPDHLLSFGG